MQNATVLNIGAGTNRHIVNVTADGDQRPDADIIGHSDIADHHAAGIDHHAIAFGGTDLYKDVILRTYLPLTMGAIQKTLIYLWIAARQKYVNI
jgi:hypothetical protein